MKLKSSPLEVSVHFQIGDTRYLREKLSSLSEHHAWYQLIIRSTTSPSINSWIKVTTVPLDWLCGIGHELWRFESLTMLQYHRQRLHYATDRSEWAEKLAKCPEAWTSQKKTTAWISVSICIFNAQRWNRESCFSFAALHHKSMGREKSLFHDNDVWNWVLSFSVRREIVRNR